MLMLMLMLMRKGSIKPTVAAACSVSSTSLGVSSTSVAHPFNDARSMTKRYLTSLFSIRS